MLLADTSTSSSTSTSNYSSISTNSESAICESSTSSVSVSDFMADADQSMSSVRSIPSESTKSKPPNSLKAKKITKSCCPSAPSCSSRQSVSTPGQRKYERKTKRFVWPEELHRLFVAAIFDVGLKNASPKALLLLMQSTGSASELTTEHLKSHLQKFRMNYERSRQEFFHIYFEQNVPTDLKHCPKQQSPKNQTKENDSSKTACDPMVVSHTGVSRKRPRHWEAGFPLHVNAPQTQIRQNRSTLSPRLPKCVHLDMRAALGGAHVAKSLERDETEDFRVFRADKRPISFANEQLHPSESSIIDTTSSHLPSHIPQRAIYHAKDMEESLFDRNRQDLCQNSQTCGRIADHNTQEANEEILKSKSREAINADAFNIETEEDRAGLLTSEDAQRQEYDGDVGSDPQWSILSSLLSPNLTVTNDNVFVSNDPAFLADSAEDSIDHDRAFTTAAERNAILASDTFMLNQDTSDVQTRMHLAMHAQMNLHRKMLSRKVAVSKHIWDDNQKKPVLAPASSMQACSCEETDPTEWAQSTLPSTTPAMQNKDIRPDMGASAKANLDDKSPGSTRFNTQTSKSDAFFNERKDMEVRVPHAASDRPHATLKGYQCDSSTPSIDGFSAPNPLSTHSIDDIPEDMLDLHRWGTLDLDVSFSDDDLFGFLKA